MAKELKRREFLKAAGVTVLAASVAGTLGGCYDLPDDPDYPDSSSSSSSSRPSSSSSSFVEFQFVLFVQLEQFLQQLEQFELFFGSSAAEDHLENFNEWRRYSNACRI